MDTVASPEVHVGGVRDIFDLAKRQGQVILVCVSKEMCSGLCS